MIESKITLADVDGTLCIVVETPERDAPELVRRVYPTGVRTRDALDTFGVTTVDRLSAKATFLPGEYFVGEREDMAWRIGRHISLQDGQFTLPIQETRSEIAPPKARKGQTVYWSGGRWIVLK